MSLKNEREFRLKNTGPAVSVVIPCRNERDAIEACLRSVLAQDLPPGGFEIIVADGMSDDGTREIVDRMSKEKAVIRVVDNPGKITPCGMNVGILEARGRYIAIMGAHNRYAADYLSQGVKVLEETAADNVGGAMICDAESYVQRGIAAAHHSFFSVGKARWHDPEYEGPADTVFGGIYRREIFDRIGFFDEELVRNQDDEFNLRLTRAGGRIWQSPRIKSWYKSRSSLLALFKQQLQYGYWKVRVIRKHTMPASVRHLVPLSFVLSVILLPLASLLWHSGIWLWFGLLGSYMICDLTVSFLVAIRREWKLLFILPLIFGCYHFGYGYGSLRGIWDFVILRRGPRKGYVNLSRVGQNSS